MAEPQVIRVNENDHKVVSDPRSPLLDVLREELGLTGTKDGCGEGECGACTVLVDGDARMACLTPLGTLAGREVTTIEGLRGDPIGERLVAAFGAAGAVLCGFCSPGFVVAARAGIVAGDGSVLDMLRGNLCRCTGYAAIVEAVTEVAEEHRDGYRDHHSGPEGRPVALDPDDPRFVVPATLSEACEALARLGGDALVVAGGTGRIAPAPGATPVWIGGLPMLSRIEPWDEFRIGAGVTWERLRTSGRIQRVLPALAEAAEAFGGPQVRNVATIGGNNALGSPGGDALPALAIHDASVELASTAGKRLVPLVEAAGRRPDELVTAVVLQHPRPDRLEFFVKVAPRKGRSVIDKVSVAFSAIREENRLLDVRIALGSAGPTVIRATAAEQLLTDSWVSAERIAAAAAAAEAVADPVDDVRPTADHRRRLVRGILVRELTRRLLL
ncbi:FAD binding domain-containing protein [Actinomycetes bacterium KLBMP 9759]